MSERLPDAAESQQAFLDVYTDLIKLTYPNGTPVMVMAEQADAYITKDEEFCSHQGEFFQKNAMKKTVMLRDEIGGVHQSWAVMLNEKGMQLTNTIGQLEIYEDSGSHPADMYKFYHDQTIEHLRRTLENDGLDADGFGINERTLVEHVGWLDVTQMQALQQIIRTAEDVATSDDPALYEEDIEEDIEEDNYLTDWDDEDETDSDREAGCGTTSHERFVEAAEAEQAEYELAYDYDEEETEDPLAGDVDRWVDPAETMTDEEREFADRHRIEPYTYDASEEYWAEHSELNPENASEEE